MLSSDRIGKKMFGLFQSTSCLFKCKGGMLPGGSQKQNLTSNYFCYSKVMWPDYQVLKTVYSKGALKPKWSSKNIDIHLKTRGFTRWNQT